MGRQTFGKSQQRRRVGLPQPSGQASQFRVIGHHVLDEPVMTGADKQRQQGSFLNHKMRIKLAGESGNAGCRRRFDCRRLTRRRGALGLQCQLQRVVMLA